ncbi:DUF1127 domain-containing protein [Dongia rigui]|uniref:DUF1127 domain-containing protein n=1 Tax=Dongia rigui TaxID=940149 RepID=A0ABU5DXP5_9PROT|nr:DUF1127 domain-containing protein [Dongia rigui]MDY0872034.1 DUF1127 domain-containing protein [Dongia rigui]
MSETCLSCEPTDSLSRTVPLPRSGRLASLVLRLLDWHARLQQRRHLSALSPHMLKDVGLTAADVHAEIGKRPWQP